MLPEIERFEVAYGAIPDDYRRFLLEGGPLVVGDFRLSDIRALWRTHDQYLREFGPPMGWSMDNVFVIGWSRAGEPLAIHRKSGRVVVERRDGRGIEVVAESFEEFVAGRR